jgi:hypothetical protein
MRENTDGPRARFHRSRFEDALCRGWQEKCRATALEVVVEVDEEGEARVDGGIGVVDVGRG